ncbi:integrin-linked kinase-associated serine/threonine phosphatase 2C isoform X1 [Rissa tridactyla]|uniref:integrin-linked kinase-associated serine/threonine phosphatase 2C isoform X1 n=2 Tax=Rissa tridactyla TaxID=75485 RepID=UPI0023BABD1B|nr:integrin-linked kinase-associated serine/threonine phosphatase 2C isoform X1 [Rissa tridactyla]XP_054062216.1 integrin-linked kinase-associated serine/threonine phosphatase 2C isoform X1 [Rissa tridactyla]
MDLFGDLPEPGSSAAGAECHPGGLALAGAFPLSVVLWIMGLWRAVMVLPEGRKPRRGLCSLMISHQPAVLTQEKEALYSLMTFHQPAAVTQLPVLLSRSHQQGTTGKGRRESPWRRKRRMAGSVGILGLKGYVAERKGEREDMQDAHVILNDITEECQPLPSQITRVSYFAVFDGHGGVRASKFAAQNLHQNLIKKFPKGEVVSVEKTVKRCLLDTFKHTDEEFLKQASSQKPAWKDGSTATCVLAVDNILYIANLGDSRAILCRYNEESQKHAALSLSKEHNPTQYEERMRIQKAGGNVRDGRVLGVLEVSRSIGDGQYKRCGVISVPDIKRCQLTHNDRFILIACDGLFKVFTPEEAVNFIVSCLEDKNIQTREGKLEADARYEAACNRLANKAVQRGSADNVTVMVVRIEH